MRRRPDTFTIEGTAVTRASKAAVVDQLLRPSTWPVWQAEIVSATGPERIGAGDVVQGRAEMMGFRVSGQSVADQVRDGVVREQVVVGVGMQITYEVEEVGGETRITHRLVARLPEGPMGRILSFFLRRRLRAMQKALLERLPEAAESDHLDRDRGGGG